MPDPGCDNNNSSHSHDGSSNSDNNNNNNIGSSHISNGLEGEPADADPAQTFQRFGLCAPLAAAGSLLWRNPRVARAVLASGLQQAGPNVANTFLLAGLMGEIWGEEQAEYGAILGMAINIVAATTGGPFGRFSDSVDRRIAAAVFGINQFLPGWAVLVFGATKFGLWASSVSKIFGSIGATSNVVLALMNDVTNFRDREVAAGIFFAGTNLTNVVINSLPLLFRSHGSIIRIYLVVINLAYFVCLASLKVSPLLIQVEGNGSESPQGRLSSAPKEGSCCMNAVVKPLRLIFCHRRLRRLCLVAFLLALANVVPMVVAQPYFNQSLGLYLYGTPADFEKVSALSTLPGQLLVLPGFLLTGFLAKQNGTLRLLWRLLPLSGVLLVAGAFMALARAYWFVPVVVIAEQYASLPNVPLMRLVAGVAPPGRMGEALSAAGVCQQIAGLLGNAIIAWLNKLLQESSIADPYWVYYPFCAVIAVTAILPLWGRPKGGWGAAGGEAKEAFFASVNAKVAGRRWRSTARMAKQRRANNSSSEDSDSSDSSSDENLAVSEESESEAGGSLA